MKRKELWLIFFLCTIFFHASSFCQDTGRWKEERSTHFIILYKNAPYEFVRQAIDKAEGFYTSIADALGFTRYDFWLWDNRAKLYIYDDADDYKKNISAPLWSGGVVDYRNKIIKTYPWEEGFFESLLPHELGHIIFREFAGQNNSAPQWIDEGVAMYQEIRKHPGLKEKLRQAKAQGFLSPLDKLSKMNVFFIHNEQKAGFFYLQSLGVIDYLLGEFGKDNFVDFCRALKEGKSFDAALNDGYRVFKNTQDLDKAWNRDYLCI